MESIKFKKPVLGLCAYSGSGKTTLLEKLLPRLTANGRQVAVIKHAHHTFDIDHPQKDSYKIRKAGAQQMLISSQKRWALMVEHEETSKELSLEQALQHICTDTIDVVMVEGFKAAPIPKIEIHRPSLDKPLISANDRHVIAIATDQPEGVTSALPLLNLNEIEEISSFIEQFLSNWST